MHTVFALVWIVMVIHWLIFPYPSGLLRWHCGNLTIAPVPAKQPWWIWINTSCEFIMNDCITTTKQSTTKPCAYFLGYTVISVSASYRHARGMSVRCDDIDYQSGWLENLRQKMNNQILKWDPVCNKETAINYAQHDVSQGQRNVMMITLHLCYIGYLPETHLKLIFRKALLTYIAMVQSTICTEHSSALCIISNDCII